MKNALIVAMALTSLPSFVRGPFALQEQTGAGPAPMTRLSLKRKIKRRPFADVKLREFPLGRFPLGAAQATAVLAIQ